MADVMRARRGRIGESLAQTESVCGGSQSVSQATRHEISFSSVSLRDATMEHHLSPGKIKFNRAVRERCLLGGRTGY
jgi:hypothetical protein